MLYKARGDWNADDVLWISDGYTKIAPETGVL
jgi:hypothetical protein